MMKKRMLIEQNLFAKLKNALFGGKELKAVKPITQVIQELKPYLKDILAAKPMIKMTDKVHSAFLPAIEQLRSANKSLAGITEHLGPNFHTNYPRDQKVLKLYQELEETVKFLDRSDGASINLQAAINNLDKIDQELTSITPNLKKNYPKKVGSGRNSSLVAVPEIESGIQLTQSKIKQSKKIIEETILGACANMLNKM